jgi:hypothetical protein
MISNKHLDEMSCESVLEELQDQLTARFNLGSQKWDGNSKTQSQRWTHRGDWSNDGATAFPRGAKGVVCAASQT